MPEGHEKRVARRYPVLGHAQILTARDRINCVVRDLSETGAKLGVNRTVRLPREFDLLLVRRKLVLRVSVRWRRGDFVGVSFNAAEQAAAAPGKAGQSERVYLEV